MFLREMLNWLGRKHELKLSYLNQPLRDTMCPSHHISTSQWLVIPRVSAVSDAHYPTTRADFRDMD
jgi:hypothetical protein